MRMSSWLKGAMVAGLGTILVVSNTNAQQPQPAIQPGQQPPPAIQPGQQPPPQPGQPAGQPGLQQPQRQQQQPIAGQRGQQQGQFQIQRLPAPLKSAKDFEEAAQLLFMVVDTNRDGQISRQEATDAAMFVVGGVFYQADKDGDGTVTADEAREVRERILQNNPVLRVLVETARNQTDQDSPYALLSNMLDPDATEQIEAREVRQFTESAVETLFVLADTDRDGQLTPGEINAAGIAMLQAAGQASFQLADKDGDGFISQEEFQQAVTEPANIIFQAVDTDGDGRLSQQELNEAWRMLFEQFQVTVPDVTEVGQPPAITVPPQQQQPGINQ